MVFPENGVIDEEWIKKIMEEMKGNKYIHKKYLITMIKKVKEYFMLQKSLIDVNIPEYVIFIIIYKFNILVIRSSMYVVMFMGNIMTFLISLM